MKLVETDTGQLLLNKWKVKPCHVGSDNYLAPFSSLREIFHVDAAYKHLCSIAAMYSDHSDLIIICGKSGGLDIKENGFFPELPVCTPVLFFLEVIGKVCVAGHLAFLLMCWYLPVSVLVLIQAVRHDGALPMPTSTSS